MKYSLKLFTIGGIGVGIHYSWIFIFLLITWSLAAGYFPQIYPEWGTVAFWIAGAVSALLLFFSVLLHELAHSFVAKARGMKVSSITLFILGGVSNLEEEPAKPGIEFFMAIVGPLTSLVLAGILWGSSLLIADRQSPVAAILSYLGLVNALLAGFNLLPGFPLDGGRVLRSILWRTTGSLVRATNIASTVGRVFGWIFIAVGFYVIFTVSILSGIWLVFIGWFLNSAADSSRVETSTREQLQKVRVRDIINLNQKTINPDTPVAQLVTSVFRGDHGRAVPVCQDNKTVGIVTVSDIKELPQDVWQVTPVKKIMSNSPLYSVRLDDSLNEALKLITSHDINQVLVMEDGKCSGMISRGDILRHLEMRRELGIPSR